MLDISDRYFHLKCIWFSNLETFPNLGSFGNQTYEFLMIRLVEVQPYKRNDRETKRLRINICVIADNHAGFFEAFNAIGNARWRHAQLACALCDRHPAVLLEQFNDFPVDHVHFETVFQVPLRNKIGQLSSTATLAAPMALRIAVAAIKTTIARIIFSLCCQ